ncbi:phosphate ABC transporter permease PstA [Rickettsiales bacterium]|nr:phosphate ABC transporter permease PstA [Rickettsiales bacterium]
MSNIEKKIKKISNRPKAYKKLMKRKRIIKKVGSSIAKRRAKETRLKIYGMAAISVSFIFLTILLYSIVSNGYTAFFQTQIQLPVNFEESLVKSKNYRKMVRKSLADAFPQVSGRKDKRSLNSLISKGAALKLKQIVSDNKEYIGNKKDIWLPASSDVDMFVKGRISKDTPEHLRKVNNQQIIWIEELQQKGLIREAFNFSFFKNGDSREPEMAGILGSFIGSVFVVISCMLLAFPLGVMTAIYLEEFAPKNKLTEFIEVNISNLAAVPSIVFGLLGLTIYLQFFGIPRSASLAGGLTLALMALPIIVIATRTSIRAIPQSIRDGAIALGASKVQTTIHHVLPLAMPGIMTGTILSISRILGETAPLLMIGMVAFVVDIPKGFLDAATAMPVQIYLWADSPEVGFAEKTSAAIIILLLLLIIANASAVYLRKKFEIRW